MSQFVIINKNSRHIANGKLLNFFLKTHWGGGRSEGCRPLVNFMVF